MRKQMVLNLFGGPGTGKSTGAAYIFSKLKIDGYDVELVTEFAKDKVYEDTKEVWNNQLYIFGKQSFRLSRIEGKVDLIITDAPILLSVYYNQGKLSWHFDEMVEEFHNDFDNINIFLKRVKEYNPKGRFQTEKQAIQIDDDVKQMLRDLNESYICYPADEGGYQRIYEKIKFVLDNL